MQLTILLDIKKIYEDVNKRIHKDIKIHGSVIIKLFKKDMLGLDVRL